VGWGTSENDVVIEQRYINGVQVGVPVGPVGGRAGDCNCRVPEASGGIYNEPESQEYALSAPQPTYRDGTPAPYENEGIDPLEGTAAWFGAEMSGTPTTSGADRSQWGVFASHPTLPYGTEVEVTNLRNKRKMHLVINDRTGVGGQRVLLVSEGAAVNLDMKRHGVVPVKLRVIPRR
jgi:rare lipoprotein A (peptidoglycan hydrolase)